ncbi:MAG: hypothetical protein ACK4FF_11640 [Limnobacter sp.]|uniref:hypothetical protein n=1 Tax=Limnobacter sp. TaxID=2003368 RepID=UPI003918FB04
MNNQPINSDLAQLPPQQANAEQHVSTCQSAAESGAQARRAQTAMVALSRPVNRGGVSYKAAGKGGQPEVTGRRLPKGTYTTVSLNAHETFQRGKLSPASTKSTANADYLASRKAWNQLVNEGKLIAQPVNQEILVDTLKICPEHIGVYRGPLNPDSNQIELTRCVFFSPTSDTADLYKGNIESLLKLISKSDQSRLNLLTHPTKEGNDSNVLITAVDGSLIAKILNRNQLCNSRLLISLSGVSFSKRFRTLDGGAGGREACHVFTIPSLDYDEKTSTVSERNSGSTETLGTGVIRGHLIGGGLNLRRFFRVDGSESGVVINGALLRDMDTGVPFTIHTTKMDSFRTEVEEELIRVTDILKDPKDTRPLFVQPGFQDALYIYYKHQHDNNIVPIFLPHGNAILETNRSHRHGYSPVIFSRACSEQSTFALLTALGRRQRQTKHSGSSSAGASSSAAVSTVSQVDDGSHVDKLKMLSTKHPCTQCLMSIVHSSKILLTNCGFDLTALQIAWARHFTEEGVGNSERKVEIEPTPAGSSSARPVNPRSGVSGADASGTSSSNRLSFAERLKQAA